MEKLSFVKEAHTENTGGGMMCDFLHLECGKLLVISDDLVCLYKDMDHFDNNVDTPQTIYLFEEPKPVRKKSYLLFGKEICHALDDGIDEVLALIDDGADYEVMETDGSDIPALLVRFEGWDSWSFITEEEYIKILNHE